jgi:UDP-N-acetylglucosamine 2-epimerase (non-hydrolysing)
MADGSPLDCEIVIGTRPEAIKLAPVIKALRAEPDFVVHVVTSGQHGEICRTALAAFGLTADSALDAEPIGGALADSAGELVRAFGRRLAKSRPGMLLVQGDTTTAMAAALAGFYAKVPVAHVEAGLRSGDLANPFPEEANRTIIDAVSTIPLPPTPQAQANLVAVGFDAKRCPVTGNTVVDALQWLCAAHAPILDGDGVRETDLNDRRLLVVTTHRRESWGGDLEAICSAIRVIAERHADVLVALPVHPNPNVSGPVTRLLGNHPRVKLLPPLSYLPFLSHLRRAYLILTDSGGVQEEAPSLGVPVLVLRKTTERPEAAQAGLARVIGTARDAIVEHVEELLRDPRAHRRMATAVNPYGDGQASKRIVEVLRNWRAGRALLPEERWFVPRLRPVGEVRKDNSSMPDTTAACPTASVVEQILPTCDRWPPEGTYGGTDLNPESSSRPCRGVRLDQSVASSPAPRSRSRGARPPGGSP